MDRRISSSMHSASSTSLSNMNNTSSNSTTPRLVQQNQNQNHPIIEECTPKVERYSYFPLNVVSGLLTVKAKKSAEFRSIGVLLEGRIDYELGKKEQISQVFSRTRAFATGLEYSGIFNDNKNTISKNQHNATQQQKSTTRSPTSNLPKKSSFREDPEPSPVKNDTFASIDAVAFSEGTTRKLHPGEQTFEFSVGLPGHALPSSIVQSNGMKMEIAWSAVAVIDFILEDDEETGESAFAETLHQEFDRCDFRVYCPVPFAKWSADTLQFRKYEQPIGCCGCLEYGCLRAEIFLHKTLLALAEDDGLMFKIMIDNTDGSHVIEAVTCTLSCTVRPKNFTRLKKNFLPADSPLFSAKSPLRETFFKKRFQLQVSPGKKETVLNRIELHPLVPATIRSPVVDIDWHFSCRIEEEGAFATNAEFHFDTLVYHHPDDTEAPLIILEELKNFEPLTGVDAFTKPEEIISIPIEHSHLDKNNEAKKAVNDDANVKHKDNNNQGHNGRVQPEDSLELPLIGEDNKNDDNSDNHHQNELRGDDPLSRSMMAGRGTLAELITKDESGSKLYLAPPHLEGNSSSPPGSPDASPLLASSLNASPKLNPLGRTGFTAFPDSDFFKKADKQSKAL